MIKTQSVCKRVNAVTNHIIYYVIIMTNQSAVCVHDEIFNLGAKENRVIEGFFRGRKYAAIKHA